jgi:two-component system phosphate regulon sensor histidine kinase PhoR
MENHMQREEVKEALTEGEGYATRVSYTLAQDMRYYAKKTADGEIIRMSMSHNSRMRLLLDTAGMMLLTIAILFLLGAAISYRVAKAIIRPINEIDLDHPDIRESYDELGPLLHRISQQNDSIRRQMEKLRKRREEFNIITENMSEGLIILDKDAEILSYNSGALKMLGVDASAAEKIEGSVLKLNRSEPFRSVVQEALLGEHAQVYIGGDDFTCEVIANPVKEGRETTGVILILMDVTEREHGERMRREFTSNVSHELKTPLTSIYGVSDMLASGMVKPEDVKGFAGTIKEESARLISLIDDIMRLSQLDENTVIQEKGVIDLWEITQEAVMRLSRKAQENDVELKCVGTSAVMKGVDYVADEIVYNLCENAIKYNKKGGSVTVTVRSEAGRCVLTVKDTGIGIPKGEQERIFERFYRVDKSHSKKIGGTGLGLSIVKHGVNYLGGTINVESEEGIGTTITVVFPKNI